jgi:UDP:flavonoid glycosyltransferase YjiC (YdhE family)
LKLPKDNKIIGTLLHQKTRALARNHYLWKSLNQLTQGMTAPEQPTVIFCPLNWGLGHISRDLPLIKAFLAKGYRVIVATDTPLTQWVKSELPELETTHFYGPKIRYSASRWQIPVLLMQVPRMAGWISIEKRRVRQLVKQYHPTLIVSDNRYGARNDSVFSVIITHQLMIKLPRALRCMEWLLHQVIRRLINQFDSCWVPDYPKKHSLAGELVHKYPLPANARLIGPLSRFDDDSLELETGNPSKTTDVLAIISGPEPQRTLLEKALKHNLQQFQMSGTIITGRPEALGLQIDEPSLSGIRLLPHLPTPLLARLIKSHKIIICRSGYSSLMDLHFLKKKAWLVATPGQTEQVYLAEFHHKTNHCCIAQKDLNKQPLGPIEDCPSPRFSSTPGTSNFRQILSDFF